jgi:hypothetical protein
MKATNKLRFVERVVPAPEHGAFICKKVRILQQWWETSSMGEVNLGFGSFPVGEIKGEWRDVPVEVEA